MPEDPGASMVRRSLRRTALLVAGLNLAYFFVEITVALAIGSVLLARFRRHGSSMARAVFLSARNDVLVNPAVIAVGILTAIIA